MIRYFYLIALFIVIVVIQCSSLVQHANAASESYADGDCLNSLDGGVQSILTVNGAIHAFCRTKKPAGEYRGPYDTTTEDYIAQAAVFGLPNTQMRLKLSVDDPNPFFPVYRVTYQYCWAGLWYFPPFKYKNDCTSNNWGDTHSETFSGGDIRGIDDVSPGGGYGSKNVSLFRICVRRVLPGQTFPGDAYPQEDTQTNPPLIGPKANSTDGSMVNLDKKNKICAYYVAPLPEGCDSAAVTASGAVVGGIIGSGFGPMGTAAGAVVGSIAATAICGAMAGDGPCKTPFFSWAKSFVGCVDEPIKPGPPLLNKVLSSNSTPVVPANYSFPKATDRYYQANLNTALNNLIAAGSTFDQPVVRLTAGSGAARLDLRYRFPGDNNSIDSKPICGSFPPAGLVPVIGIYCATVDQAAPDKVCACLSTDGVTCSQQIMGCAPRPTPRQSSVLFNLSATSLTTTNKFDVNPNNIDIANKLFKPNVYPALKIAFQAYYDAAGDRVFSINTRCVKAKDTTIPASSSSICSDPNALRDLPLSVQVREYYRKDTNPPLDQTTPDYTMLNTSSPTNDMVASREQGEVYGVFFQTMIPLFDNVNRVQYTNIITENDVSPSPNNPSRLACSLSCHEDANFNKCITFWTTAQNYYNCVAQDLSCLIAGTGKSCICGAPPQQITGGSYLASQYFVPAGQRVYQGVCTNDGTGTKSNLITYQGASMTLNNWLVTPSTSLSVINKDINSKCSSSLDTGPSDQNALNVYCPGVLYEEPFEDMDNSKICLQMAEPKKWILLTNEIYPDNHALCKKPRKICSAYNTPTSDSMFTTFPRPTRIVNSAISSQVTGTCSEIYGLEQWRRYDFISIYPPVPNNYVPLSQNDFCTSLGGATQGCPLTATINDLHFRDSTAADGSVLKSYLKDTKTLSVPISSLLNATSAQLDSFVTNFTNQFTTMAGYTQAGSCTTSANTSGAPASIPLTISLNYSNKVNSYSQFYNVLTVSDTVTYTFSTPNIFSTTAADLDNFINSSITDLLTNKNLHYTYAVGCWKGYCVWYNTPAPTYPNIGPIPGMAAFMASKATPVPSVNIDQNNPSITSAIANFRSAVNQAKAGSCSSTPQTFTLSSTELAAVLNNSIVMDAISAFKNCAAVLNSSCADAYQIYQTAIGSVGLQNFCDTINQQNGTNLSCTIIYNTYKTYITDSAGNSLIGAAAPLPYVDPNLVKPLVDDLNAWTYANIMTNVPSDEYAHKWVNDSLKQKQSRDARVLISSNYIAELLANYVDPNTTVIYTKATNKFTFTQNAASMNTDSLVFDVVKKDFTSRSINIDQLNYFFSKSLEIDALNIYRPANPGFTDTGLTYQYTLDYFINAIKSYINAVYQNNLIFYQFKLTGVDTTPTRTCNYNTGAETITNHCVSKPGCYRISYNAAGGVPADFAKYCTWNTPADSSIQSLGLSFSKLTGSVIASGFCVYDSGLADTPPTATLSPRRNCNAIYIGKNKNNIDQYFKYWAPIDATNPDIQKCVSYSE